MTDRTDSDRNKHRDALARQWAEGNMNTRTMLTDNAQYSLTHESHEREIPAWASILYRLIQAVIVATGAILLFGVLSRGPL